MYYKNLAFLKGKRRKSVFLCFKENKILTITEIKKMTNRSLSGVSLAVSEIKERGLIISKNSESYHNQHYELSKTGKSLIKEF